MEVTIGGDRIGSGNKMKANIRNYERSTHDRSYVWRSSMSCGTLVPFMNEIGLPGDSLDIELSAHVLTLPTIGPLFGSYKVQMDVFEVPVRLYQGKLHMNQLGIGMDMASVKLPLVKLEGKYLANGDSNHQIKPSSIWKYLGVSGMGRTTDGLDGDIVRMFNATPYLAYWDIYKNYYANKQEERGFVIHNEGFTAGVTTEDTYGS